MRGTWLLVSALAGCSLSAEPIDPADIEVAGCASVLAGPLCALGRERSVSIWLRAASASGVAFRAGGREVEATRVEAADGARFSVVVPEGATELEITVEASGRRRGHVVRLTEPVVFERVSEARGRLLAGDAEGARADLVAALPRMDGLERSAALGLLARIVLSLGRTDEAIDLLEQARALELELGCLSCAREDGAAAAYALIHHRRDLLRARGELAALQRDCAADDESRVYVPYMLGLLDRDSGDLRSSMRSLESARQAALRQGNERMRRSALQLMAVEAQMLGEHETAARLLAQLREELPPDSSPCERADLSTNLGWVSLLEADALQGSAPAADSDLRAALRLYETDCPKPAEAANVLVNLALAAVLRGDLASARDALSTAQTRTGHAEPRLRLWQLDVAGRIALAAGQPALADAKFAELDELAGRIDAVDARWRAAQGRAQALWAMGRRQQALESFALSEDLLDQAAMRVALGDGRDSFYGSYARGTAAYVEALLAAGLVRDAAGVARRGRSRLLHSVARLDRLGSLSDAARARWDEAVGRYRVERDALERDAAGEWRLAADARERERHERQARQRRLRSALDDAFAALDRAPGFASPGAARRRELAPPPAGELVLVYYPVRSGWIAMSEDSHGAAVARFAARDLDEPERLLVPFEAEIERASRIRVVSVGAAEGIDFHALPWRGAPLVAHAPVAYGQDSAPATPPAGTPGGLRATLVADPTGRLPAARLEADDVRIALAARDWNVDVLLGPSATAAKIGAAAGESMLLHFAGHGESPGKNWESGLRLGHGSLLSVGDILVLPLVPRVVVLAACDTARVRGSSVTVVGVAQAFLSAGTGAAVAATRQVDDGETRQLMRELYRHLVTVDGWGVAEALRQAQLARAAHVPAERWAAFRVLLP